MDLNQAILYAQIVNAAYAVDPTDLQNRAGQVVSAGLGAAKKDYVVITSLYANDLATQKNPNRARSEVSIGFVLQAKDGGEAVIAFRGTEGIREWVIDASFGTKPCPFLASAGQTEDGFTDMYRTVRIEPGKAPTKLPEALPGLNWKPPVESLTVCGHSLGGALATLAALDIAVHGIAPYHDPTVYTYASPRTGDVQFATKYNQIVPNTYRIANDLDLVPKLPMFPPYQHVMGEFGLKPFTIFPPKFLLQPNPVCEHILTSYLHLLSLNAGGEVLQPKDACQPHLSFSEISSQIEMKWGNTERLKQEFSADDNQQPNR